MNSGASYRDSDHISPHPLRRNRKNVIESDPEDDVEPPLHKYTRPDGSTPTYNMDTDISTLEAPTFTTLSHGPSVNVLQALKWDHQPTLIGTKVVNPILHVCDKCQHPIIRYGRLNCKHVLCHSCASGLLKEISNCIRCNTKVTGVEEVGLGRLFVCSYGGSRYGSDGCRRTYLSERDLNAHVDFRHLKQQTSNNLPSTEAINAATAALAASSAEQNVQSQRGGSSSSNKMRTSNQNNPNSGGSSAGGPPSFSQNQFSQPPPPVNMSAASNNRNTIHGAASSMTSSNLITVPIQDNSSTSTGSSNEYWTSKVPIHQPPPNYYNPGAGHVSNSQNQSSHNQHHHQHHYSTQVSSGGNGNNYGGGNYRTASGYHRR